MFWKNQPKDGKTFFYFRSFWRHGMFDPRLALFRYFLKMLGRLPYLLGYNGCCPSGFILSARSACLSWAVSLTYLAVHRIEPCRPRAESSSWHRGLAVPYTESSRKLVPWALSVLVSLSCHWHLFLMIIMYGALCVFAIQQKKTSRSLTSSRN